MSKPPLRPITPIDPALSRPTPDEETEIGKANRLAERYKKPDSSSLDDDEGKGEGPKA